MAGRSDELTQRLLHHIALSGSQGVGKHKFEQLVKEYYDEKNATTEDIPDRPADDLLFSSKPPGQKIVPNESLYASVLGWLSKHSDIEIRQSSNLEDAHSDRSSPIDTTSSQSSLSGKRIFTTEDRMWQTIAGHGIDYHRIPVKEFDCLSVIAAHGPAGILQPLVTKITGQDKRSVPKRTDRLRDNGYIIKTAIVGGGSSTSLLKLKKFVNDEPNTAQLPAGLSRGPPGSSIIDYDSWFRQVIKLLEDNGRIVSTFDLRLGLGVRSSSWEGRIYKRCITRLCESGCVRRVSARMLDRDGNPIKTSIGRDKKAQSIQLLRDPTEADRVAWMKNGPAMQKARENNARSGQLEPAAEDEDDDDDDAAISDEEHDTIVDVNVSAPASAAMTTNTVIEGHSTPCWTADVPLPNTVYDLVHESGRQGISTKGIAMQTTGPLWRKPLDEIMAKLTDSWQYSQPAHLQHLTIVKDTAVEGKAAVFQFRSRQNFEDAVKAGEAVSSAVQSRLGPQSANTSDLDQWGFPKHQPKDFMGRDGRASLGEVKKGMRSRSGQGFNSDASRNVVRHEVDLSDATDNTEGIPSPVKIRDRPTRKISRPIHKRWTIPDVEYAEYDKIAQAAAERVVMLEVKASKKRKATIAQPDGDSQRPRKVARRFTTTLNPEVATREEDDTEVVVADLPPDRIAHVKADLLSREKPGVYINPPGARFRKMEEMPQRGRPRNALIAVIKTEKLRQLSWFKLDNSSKRAVSSKPKLRSTDGDHQDRSRSDRLQSDRTLVNRTSSVPLPQSSIVPNVDDPGRKRRRLSTDLRGPRKVQRTDRFSHSESTSVAYLPNGSVRDGGNGSEDAQIPDRRALTDPDSAPGIFIEAGIDTVASPPFPTSSTSPALERLHHLKHKRGRKSRETHAEIQRLEGEIADANIQTYLNGSAGSMTGDRNGPSQRLVHPSLQQSVDRSFVEMHPDETFHHRGGGKWFRGLPPPGSGKSVWSSVRGPGASLPKDHPTLSTSAPSASEIVQAVEEPITSLANRTEDGVVGQDDPPDKSAPCRTHAPPPATNNTEDIHRSISNAAEESLSGMDTEHTLSSIVHAGTRRTGGTVNAQRQQIILHAIRQCGGVFPGNNELWYVCASVWNRLFNQIPDKHTIARVIDSLIQGNKLKKLTFKFNTRKGSEQARAILAEPEIPADSDIVKDMRDNIKRAFPYQHLPPEVEVTPELRAQATSSSRQRKGSTTGTPSRTIAEPSGSDTPKSTVDDTLAVHQTPAAAAALEEAARRMGYKDAKEQREHMEILRAEKQARYSKLWSHKRRIGQVDGLSGTNNEISGEDGQDGWFPITSEQASMQNQIQLSNYEYDPALAAPVRAEGSRKKIARQLRFHDSHATGSPHDSLEAADPATSTGRYYRGRFGGRGRLGSLAQRSDNFRQAFAQRSELRPYLTQATPQTQYSSQRYLPSIKAHSVLLPSIVNPLPSHRQLGTNWIASKYASFQAAVRSGAAKDNQLNTISLPGQKQKKETDTDVQNAVNLDRSHTPFGALPSLRAHSTLNAEWLASTAPSPQSRSRRGRKPKQNKGLATPLSTNDDPGETTAISNTLSNHPELAPVAASTTQSPHLRSVLRDPIQRKRVYRRRPAEDAAIADLRAGENEAQDSDTEYTPSREIKKPRAFKGRDRESAMNFKDGDRLVIAIALVTVICSDVSLDHMNWTLTAYALNNLYEGDFLRRRWVQYRAARRADVERWQSAIDDQLLRAYDEGQISKEILDLEDLDLTDWPGLMALVENNVTPPRRSRNSSAPELPNTLSDFAKHFTIVKRHPAFELSRDDYFTSITDTNRRFLATHYHNGTSLSVEHIRESDDMILAKSWVRAVSMTKQSNYKTNSAANKLRLLPEETLERAVAELVESRYLVQDKKGRQLPGRNYQIQQDVFNQLIRWPGKQDEYRYLRMVAKARTAICKHFETTDQYELRPMASDPEYTVITNMVAQGLIQPTVSLPPIKHGYHEPPPKLSPWGYGGASYETKKVNASILKFPIMYQKTFRYTSQHGLEANVPIPHRPPNVSEQEAALIPIWIDIHDNLIDDVWDMVLRSLLHLVVFRPGITPTMIEKAHSGKLWTWEIEVALEWMAEVGLVERCASGEDTDGVWHGGWKAGEWWYCAFLPEVAIWNAPGKELSNVR